MYNDVYLNKFILDYINDHKKYKSIIKIYKSVLKKVIKYYNINYKDLYNGIIKIKKNNEKKTFEYYMNFIYCKKAIYKNLARYIFEKYILLS